MRKYQIVDAVRRARLEIERALDAQKKVSAKVVSRLDPTKITMAEIDEEIARCRREKHH